MKSAFHGLLEHCARQHDWTLVPEWEIRRSRQHLAEDFDKLYVLDPGGNVRKNPKLSGTTHNVFGVQVGVSINIFVRTRRKSSKVQT